MRGARSPRLHAGCAPHPQDPGLAEALPLGPIGPRPGRTAGMLLPLVALALVAAPTTLKVGDAAPAFSATAHSGATVSLKDFAGKKLVLWFYPRASTGG